MSDQQRPARPPGVGPHPGPGRGPGVARGTSWGCHARMVIRWAEDGEAETVRAVVASAFATLVLEPPSSALRETVEDVRAAMRVGRVAVAEVPRVGVVGSIRCVVAADHVYLGRLAVLPAWQRQGIGRALVAFVEAHGRESGVPEARLGTRASQTMSAAYGRWGYTVHERAPHGADEVLWMRKRLDGAAAVTGA